MRKWIIPVLIGALAVSAQAQDSKSSDDKPKVAPKREAPPITLKAGDAAPVLKADKWLQGAEIGKFEPGKIYVVEFWATWCGPCIVMMPHLSELQEQYKNKITVIGYSAKDPNNSEEKVTEFVKKRGPKLHYTFAYADTRDSYNDWMRAAGQNGIPCTFVVDKEGKIAYIGHPMFLDVVLPGVVDGSWKASEGKEKIEAVMEEYRKASTALRTNPLEGLKAIAEFEKKYPGLEKIPYTIPSKLSAMLKADRADDVSKYARELIQGAVKADNNALLGQIAMMLSGPDAKKHKDLLVMAMEAAQANVKIAGEKDATAQLYLAQALFANDKKEEAKKAAQKAIENAPTEPMKNALKARLREILGEEAAPEGKSGSVPATRITPPADKSTRGTPAAKPVKIGEPIAVQLSLGDLKAPNAPRYSPPGMQSPVKAVESPLKGVDHLGGTVQLGPKPGTKFAYVLARSAKDKPHDTLYIDADGDGKIDETPIVATPKESRGKMWLNFDVTLKVPYGSEKTAYPAVMWAMVDKAEDTPVVMLLSRRGYLTGTVTLDGKKHTIILSDANNDAVITNLDWWELQPENTAPTRGSMAMRRVGEHQWAGEKAYMLEPKSENGLSVQIVEVKPAMTKSEEEAMRDPYREDRTAVKAAKPVSFRKDVDAALKEAAEAKKIHFIKFEAEWCGPCKLMNELVFTAKDVANAAESIVCIKVDGDERKDILEKMSVNAFPTGVLIGPDGKEIARFVGYQNVKKMTAFLQKAKSL